MGVKAIKKNYKYIITVFIIIFIIAGGVIIRHKTQKTEGVGTVGHESNVNSKLIAEDIKSKIESYQSEKLIDYDYSVKEKNAENDFLSGYYAFNVQKNNSLAIKYEDEALEIDDKYYKAYNLKGIALCYSGQFNEGMKNINEALKLNPDYGYARFNKALAYELYGYYDTALEWYHKAIEIENYPWSYYGISCIYARRGDVADTVKYLKIAIELEPDAKAAARIQKDYDNVKNSSEFQEVIK